MADLKPCPFCGSQTPLVLARTCNKDSPYDPADRAYPEVRCRDCNASAPGENWKGEDTAIKAWNTRATNPRIREVNGNG